MVVGMFVGGDCYLKLLLCIERCLVIVYLICVLVILCLIGCISRSFVTLDDSL